MAKRVLIIEDEPSTRALLQLVLETEGYDVCLAETAAEALACLAQSPDVILLSQHLPDMATLDLLQIIKAQSTSPILLLTAEQALNHEPGLPTLVDATHPKPVTLRTLFKQVAALLDPVPPSESGLSLSNIMQRLIQGRRFNRGT